MIDNLESARALLLLSDFEHKVRTGDLATGKVCQLERAAPDPYWKGATIACVVSLFASTFSMDIIRRDNIPRGVNARNLFTTSGGKSYCEFVAEFTRFTKRFEEAAR